MALDEIQQKKIDQINEFLQSKNIAEEISDDELTHIGAQLKSDIETDIESRKDWVKNVETWMKLATQVYETKTWPWPNASNVKFPLLATAAMQFSARAYPALVPGPNLVHAYVVGKDTDGQKQETAKRVSKHLSYQILHQMDGWEEDMDKLTTIIPLIGCAFKKTYYDSSERKNKSELIFPQNLIVEYYAKSIDKAYRKTEIVYLTKNDVWSRVQEGLWLDVIKEEPHGKLENSSETDKISGVKEPSVTDATPYTFYECHTFWDLDGDGYAEPYIITLDADTGKVVRIVARYSASGVKTSPEGKLIKIVPDEYYTKFPFFPNPDGSIYDVGFGHLLGGINESVNTLTNQLIDSGTINNLSSGFLGRGIRVKAGNSRFLPGEWKPVDFTGDDIKKHIFPLPSKDPSSVLFQLVEALVSSGKELASVAEIFVGKMPGQNTPATTTMATIEQGLKVFTAIHKRIYRALGEEYYKIFKLNSKFLPDEKLYFTINQIANAEPAEVLKTDYDIENIKVKPNADPNIVSQAQQLMKVQYVGQFLQLGAIDPQKYVIWALEAGEIDNYQQLLRQGPPPPSPEEQAAQQEAQMMEKEGQMKAQEHQMRMQEIQQKVAATAQDNQFKQQAAQLDLSNKEREAFIKMMGESQKVNQNLQFNEAKNQQTLRHNEEKAAQQKKQQGQKKN